MIMPMAVIVFAVSGAISTNAMSKSSKKAAPIQGYTHTSPTSACNISNMCSNVVSSFCTVGPSATRLWGLDANGQTCNVAIYKP